MQYGYLPTRGEWPTVTTTDFRFIEAGRVGGQWPSANGDACLAGIPAVVR
jgi:hypothetical protein